MSTKKAKSQRGVPENPYGEVKSEGVYLKLTPTGKKLFEQVAKRCGSQAEFVERAVRDGLAFSRFVQEDRFSTVAFLENLLLLRRLELDRSLYVGRRLTPELENLITTYLSNFLSLRRDELNRRGFFANRRLAPERKELVVRQIADLENLIDFFSQSFDPDYEALIHRQIIELEDLIEKLSF